MKKSVYGRLLTPVFAAVPFFMISCGNNVATNNNGTGSDSAMSSASATSGSSLSATATLDGTKPDTTVSGTVRFDGNNGQVKMNLEITVPKKASQSVAVHIHAMPDCGEMGKHAGGHWNPTNKQHGKWGSDNFHSGDIGNINLDANGKGTLQLTSDLWSIGGDSTKNILNKTIIVHSGVDDYTSQPAGNSGERIGCGVIKITGQ